MNNTQHPANPPPMLAKSAVAKKWPVAILVLAFAFVLMPFLLWYMTTFSRTLTDADLETYFTESAHPRRAQHALWQIADRIVSPNPAVHADCPPTGLGVNPKCKNVAAVHSRRVTPTPLPKI